MGIALKNKRKINFLEKKFFWWVKPEFDGNGGMLEISIATDDKRFLVKYFAVQKQQGKRYLIVIGSEFPGLKKKTGNCERFACPDFIPMWNNQGIGPKNIKSILEWCYDLNKVLIPVDHKGKQIGESK